MDFSPGLAAGRPAAEPPFCGAIPCAMPPLKDAR
jgi:hypothetical protein